MNADRSMQIRIHSPASPPPSHLIFNPTSFTPPPSPPSLDESSYLLEESSYLLGESSYLLEEDSYLLEKSSYLQFVWTSGSGIHMNCVISSQLIPTEVTPDQREILGYHTVKAVLWSRFILARLRLQLVKMAAPTPAPAPAQALALMSTICC